VSPQDASCRPALGYGHADPAAASGLGDKSEQEADDTSVNQFTGRRDFLRPSQGGARDFGFGMLLTASGRPKDLALYLARETVPGPSSRHRATLGNGWWGHGRTPLFAGFGRSG
jgi:hypothetical protein